MAVHMRNGIQYGGIPNGTVKGTTPSTVPTTVKQLNQIGTVGDIAPVTIPSAVKFSNGNTLETAIGSVATIETSPAVATHAVGDYVFYNGQMYKVIAAIAVGETLTVGTNITATTVGSELTALNNKYYYRDYSFTLSYSGGTIGTRGAQGYFGLDSDAVAVSATITYVSSSDRFIPVVFTSTSSGTNPAIYCNLYRCDTNSLSSAPQVTARVLYRRN